MCLCGFCRADKDASVWSKEKLKSLLVGLTIEGKEGVFIMCMMHNDMCERA